MYKHIIWDFDGTLFDTYPMMARVFKDLLQENGIDEPLEEIITQMKVSASAAMKHYERKYQITEAFIANYKEKQKLAVVEQAEPFAGIKEICSYIHTTNRKNYLLTHRGQSSITVLKKHGLFDYFSAFITSEQGFERKPSPAAIHYLMNEYHMLPSESIMVGDRDLDLLSGKNAGISACYFSETHATSEHADYNIFDFQQLYEIIS
ncbi:HAD-IA family hydrolase [Paraliobacillus ryukyuensis]|uniref:HAD-IA family hydrolase n=1 Tax=Paraliobacillus ryukyuensis TaxID=200904 RepID=UPI0009A6DC34|nr:HAD-IA family hydrolase [Paraliobacillus ryukyuensis]